MNSRIPPQNIDAEASLLGSILIDQEVMTNIADKLDPSDFYDPRHQKIYEAIAKLYNNRKPIDLLTLTEELSTAEDFETIGGSSYLTELTNLVPSAAHAEHYGDIVLNKSVRRRLIKASEDITNFGFSEDKPLRELLESAESRLFAVSQKEVKQDLVSLESILSSSFDRLDELQKNKSAIRGTPTGFRDLDKMLSGMQRSDLIILAARPSMGKSTLALNIGQNAAKAGHAVLVFSLEMSKEQLVDRMLASEAGIDAWNIRTGNLSDQDFERLGHAMGTLSEAPLYIDDTPGITVSELRTKARRELHKQPIGLIIIDYLQLMSGGGKFAGSDNRVQEISEISRGLKSIARELNVPVVALSQLSRSVESRNPQIPQLADLRESGSIEQDADVVLFIYREDYYNPETDRQHITDILIRKHRNGPTGNVELYFNNDRVQFLTLEKQSHNDAPVV